MDKAFYAPTGWSLSADAIDRVVAEMLKTRVDTSPHRWQASTAAAFSKVREQWGGYSNMANSLSFTDPATGLHWGSSEAWYQAQRFPEDAAHQRAIMKAPHAFASKEVAYQKISESRRDWAEIKVPMMARALALKAQNPAFVALLSDSGTLTIVEKSFKDGFWGAKTVEGDAFYGANVLGQLLMALRAVLAEIWREQLEAATRSAIDLQNGKTVDTPKRGGGMAGALIG